MGTEMARFKQAENLFKIMGGAAFDAPLLSIDMNSEYMVNVPLVRLNKPGKRSFEEMMAAMTGTKPALVVHPQMPTVANPLIVDMEGKDCIVQPLMRRTRRTRSKASRDAEKAALNGEPQKKKRKRFPRIVIPQPLKWDVPKELQKPAMDANLLVAHESVGALLTILPGLPALKREPEEAYTSNVSLEALAASARDAIGHAGPSVIIKREDLTRCRG